MRISASAITRRLTATYLYGAIVAVAAIALVSACSSSDLSSPTPTTPKCQLSVSVSPGAVASSGGSALITVTAQPECAWVASSKATWIADVAPVTGQGRGEISVRVAANTAQAARSGSVDVGGVSATIAQDAAAPCTFAVNPTAATVPSAAGTITIGVTAAEGCAWTATSSSSVIQVTSGATGTGSGVVTLTVAANTGVQRVATATVAGQTVTLTQQAPGCTFAISPLAQALPFGASSGSLTLSTNVPACAWTATSSAPWLTVAPASASGSGNATIAYTATLNPGAERTGTIAVGGETLLVTQAAAPACNYVLSAASQSVPAGGGAATAVSVTTASYCGWTAVSNSGFVAVTSGASGTGNGSVGLSLTANPGAQRVGTVTIAGQTHTITQASASCAYTLTPASRSVAAAGQNALTFDVATAAHCGWTAAIAPSTSWLSIASGGSGTGNGTVTYNVAANSGAARSGDITVGGQAHTVSQTAATCSFSINPTANSGVPAGGATGQSVAVTVTAGSNCSWAATVSPSSPWITVSSGASGTGNGTVVYNVAANSGGGRSGSIDIAGQTHAVTQAAATCTFSLSPTSRTDVSAAGATGESVSVTVTAGSNCAWSATSNDSSMLTIASGAGPNTGNGTVTFNVSANAGSARSGSLTIAGTTFQVTQQGAPALCSYGISADPPAFPASGGSGTVTVTAGATCDWTAVSNDNWITITSGASGTSNGSVGYTVDGGLLLLARSGSITVAGKTYSITQNPIL